LADILIEGGFVITMDSERKVIRDGGVVMDKGRIVFVGKKNEARRKFRVKKIIDASKCAIIPGLINAHTHLFQSLLRNLGTDMELLDWLKTSIHPAISCYSEGDVRIAAFWGIIENIKSGVTCVIENHYGAGYYETILDAMIETGIRGCLARGIYEINVVDELKEKPDEAIASTERLVKRYHGAANGRIMVAVAPMHPCFASKELLLKAKELSDKYGILYHTHTAESKRDQELNVKSHGKTDVELLHELGILSPKYHAVHAVWVSEKEIKYLAETGAHVIHNPVSNMYLASGIAPIPEMLKAGINVALGTDGPASNNTQDMLQTMKFAACLHKVSKLNSLALTAWDVLEMATINGAKALGLEKELGSLEVGKKADITIINLDKPHIKPIHDPVGSIVYCANCNDVETVIIDGKIVMENRKILTLDEKSFAEKAESGAYNIKERIKERFNIEYPFEKHMI